MAATLVRGRGERCASRTVRYGGYVQAQPHDHSIGSGLSDAFESQASEHALPTDVRFSWAPDTFGERPGLDRRRAGPARQRDGSVEKRNHDPPAGSIRSDVQAGDQPDVLVF